MWLGDDPDAASQIPPFLTVRMHRGRTLTGTVYDIEARPVAGAEVSLRSDNFNYIPQPLPWPEPILFESPSHTQATTDADGNWTITNAPVNTNAFGEPLHLEAAARHDDFLFARQPIQAGQAHLTLDKGFRLAGTVVDVDGQPVAGAIVHLPSDLKTGQDIETGADGTFLLPARANGSTIAVAAYKPGHGVRTDNIALPAEPVTLQLSRPVPIEGQIVDSAGEPITGATVVLRDPASAVLPTSVNTDSAGRFSIADGPDRPVRLMVFADGFDEPYAKGGLHTTPGEPLVVEMLRDPTFTVTAVDAETGEPVGDGLIVIGAVFPWEDSGRIHVDPHLGPDPLPLQSGHWHGTQDLPVGGATQGVVRVEVPGYAPATSAVLEGEGPHDVRLELHKAGPTRGLVISPAGSPLGGVDVIIALPNAQFGLLDRKLLGWDTAPRLHATTDDDGRFELPPQTGTFFVVAWSDAGFAMARRKGSQAGEPITLEPWVTAKIAWPSGESPTFADAATSRIEVRQGDDMECPPRLYGTVPIESADGKTVLPDLPQVPPSLGGPVVAQLDYKNDAGVEEQHFVALPAAGGRIDLVGRSAHGWLQLGDDSLPGQWIALTPAGYADNGYPLGKLPAARDSGVASNARANDEGRINLTCIRPGDYRVTAYNGKRSSREHSPCPKAPARPTLA